VASESLFSFATAIKGRDDNVTIHIQESQESILIPRKALELLSFILTNMAEGKATSLLPTDSDLSTQQGADLLNVSRPHIVKLLEQGTIPFKKVGSHRRILLADLLTYQAAQQQQRQQSLQFLAQQAQELNLGYE